MCARSCHCDISLKTAGLHLVMASLAIIVE